MKRILGIILAVIALYFFFVMNASAEVTLVRDINIGANGSSPSELTDVDGTLLFAADDGDRGVELWISNGTGGGTLRVKDINTAGDSSLSGLTNVNGTLFFAADDGTNGRELWTSDGTEAGTVLVKDIRPGADGSTPNELTNVSGTLFFAADDGSRGRELWKTSPANLVVNGESGCFISSIVSEIPSETTDWIFKTLSNK